eukprot:11879431-Karenia_brevis.AAC.1
MKSTGPEYVSCNSKSLEQYNMEIEFAEMETYHMTLQVVRESIRESIIGEVHRRKLTRSAEESEVGQARSKIGYHRTLPMKTMITTLVRIVKAEKTAIIRTTIITMA